MVIWEIFVHTSFFFFPECYQVAPGDVVELSGIFLPMPYTGFRAMRAGLVADTFLEAMSITHFKKKYEEYAILQSHLLLKWISSMICF